MKKILSAVLVLVMSLTMVLAPTSYAAEASVTMSDVNIKGLLDILAASMPADATQRVEIFEYFRDTYVPNDDNIGNLITIVKDLENYDKGFIGKILNNLNKEELAQYKNEMVFVLCVLKALPNDQRVLAVSDFEENRGKPLSNDESFQKALAKIYSRFVTDSKGYLAVHSIDDDALLRLAGAFKDNVMFTNGNSKAFALHSVSSTFKSNLAAAINEHFSEINGTTITASNAADVALDAMVDVLNGISGLERDLTTVLGNSAVGLYEVISNSKDDDKDDITGTISPGTVFIPGGSIDPTPTIPPTQTEDKHTYSDTTGHWSNPYVTSLSKRGIFKGYEDGSFRPEQQITREEIAVAMMRALGLEEAAANAPETNFADGTSISAWARDAVNLMVELGIFTGYDDNSFKPGQVITREEIIAVLIRKIGVGDAEDHGFIDAEHIGDWAEQYIKHAVEINLVNGYPDGTFKPANPVTRGETAKMLYGFMNHIG